MLSRSLFALTAGSLAAAIPAHAARQDGLVAYFTFDDEREPLKNSAVLPGPDGVPIEAKRIGDGIGISIVPGKFGLAASFNNPGGPGRIADWAISLGNLDRLYEGSFTVAFWLYADAAGTSSNFIIGDKDAEPTSAGVAGWRVSSTNARHFLIRPTSGESLDAYSPYLFSTKKWRHIAISVDRADSGVVALYVDGRLLGSDKLQVNRLGNQKATTTFKLDQAKLGTGLPTVVGASAGGTYGATCKIDELAFWNRVLSPAEISALGFESEEVRPRRIPEASSLVWLGAGSMLAGLAAFKRRRRKTV